MKNYKTLTQPKKSLNTQFREDLIFVIIGCFIIYVVERFFSFILRPLHHMSDEEINEKVEEKIQKKREARKSRLLRISQIETDPMYQYYLRFIEAPKDFKNDPDNIQYNAWFQEWKKGNIIDSTLRWAPDVLKTGKINPVFIEYMKIQLDLHKRASFSKRAQFSNTIYKYYPELSYGLKNMEKDLINYEAEITEADLQVELGNEIQKFGLPESIAGYLVEQDITPTQLRKTAKKFKDLIEEGISSEVCIFVHENDLDKEAAAIIYKITEQISLPPRVAYAYLKGEMSVDEVKELHDLIENVLESYGHDAFLTLENGNTIYDDYIDVSLKNYRANKFAKK